VDTKILEKVGLTKNESIVYLTLLRLGTSKTGDILNGSGLNSGKIYEILGSLKVKGLVSESIMNNIRFFSAAPPSQILGWLDIKKEEIATDEEIIRKELPQLEMLRKEGVKEVKSVTYTGFRGFKTAVEEAFSALEEGDEILGMGITSKKDRKFNDFWLRFGEERVRRKIQAKNLFSERSGFMSSYEKIRLTENRVLQGITPVTVDVFGKDKVLVFNYSEPTSCIVIYDENTATSFRNFFYQLWKIAKK
jgi:sugar-specific transcriptional regulator TrmB